MMDGQPNIYALFMAIGAGLLRPGGEMVAITPRSFCNGLYFRGFRRWFFERVTLKHAHLFESRKDIFREAGILQESLITVTERLGTPTKKVVLTTSHGRSGLEKPRRFELPTAEVVDDSCGDMVVRLPESPADADIMRAVECWPARFSALGLKISTGPVVSFRSRQFLKPSLGGRDTVPLILVGNVKLFETVWPLERNGKPGAFLVTPRSTRMLVPTQNYVLLRRFTAKEERRRLIASCFLRREFSGNQVALENHLNYISHSERELSENETFGLAALFNSFLLDRYFRALSGNTQVNATEIRTMPFPDLKTVASIGRRLRRGRSFAARQVDAVVLEELGVKTALKKRLLETAR